jgi:hypothetical protein
MRSTIPSVPTAACSSAAPTARGRWRRSRLAPWSPRDTASVSTPRRTWCTSASATASTTSHQVTPTARRGARGGLRGRGACCTTRARLAVPATYFELTTAAALLLFARAGVEVAVLEVGLGGRHDATNVVDARHVAITSIALDHTAHLGHTVEAIAREKAGIIKPDTTVISGVRQPTAQAVLNEVAADQGARVLSAHEASDGRRGRPPGGHVGAGAHATRSVSIGAPGPRRPPSGRQRAGRRPPARGTRRLGPDRSHGRHPRRDSPRRRGPAVCRRSTVARPPGSYSMVPTTPQAPQRSPTGSMQRRAPPSRSCSP